MELSDKDIALIESYLQGKLEGEELVALEQRMADDPAFKEEVDTYAVLFKGIALEGRKDLKKQLSAIQLQMEQGGELKDYQPGKGGSGGGSTMSGWGIGIMAVVVTGAVYWVFKTPAEKETIQLPKQDSIIEIKQDTAVLQSDSIMIEAVDSIVYETETVGEERSSILVEEKIRVDTIVKAQVKIDTVRTSTELDEAIPDTTLPQKVESKMGSQQLDTVPYEGDMEHPNMDVIREEKPLFWRKDSVREG